MNDDPAYDALRTGFTAAVSHELRTPLARILALLDNATLPGADVRSLIDQARAEVESAGELIDEILFLSELESGSEVVSLSPTPARPILDEVASAFDASAARAGVAVAVEGDGELPLRPRMVRILAENLTENAIRYAGHGAHFALELSNGQLVARDDGIGVGAADLPRLFERFYRSDSARSTRGTGLGLAIVKHIVASAGGSVEARSERGAGLEIRCSFSP